MAERFMATPSGLKPPISRRQAVFSRPSGPAGHVAPRVTRNAMPRLQSRFRVTGVALSSISPSTSSTLQRERAMEAHTAGLVVVYHN